MKFELDKDEQKRLSDWDKKHLLKFHNNEEPYCGAIGGRISFIICPTSIGQMLHVRCDSCSWRNDLKKEDWNECLTDFSDW